MENQPNTAPQKPRSALRFIRRTVVWLFTILLLLSALLAGLLFYYEDDVKAYIIKELNKNLNSEVKIDPKNIDLTFIRSFPKCALEFKDVLMLEALKKKNRDTLVYAEKLSLLFSLSDLMNKNYTIKKIELLSAVCKLSVDKKGNPNYIFWKDSETKSAGDSLGFALEHIELKNVSIHYKNAREKIRTSVLLENTLFSGKFSEAEYSMQAQGNAKLGLLQMNKAVVLKNKNLSYDFNFDIANNIYKINTAELGLNEMFFSIAGNFNYADSLQSSDLNFTGKNIDIEAVLSLLPEEYAHRMDDYKSEGHFFTDGKLKYRAGKPVEVNGDFGIKDATVIYKPQNSELKRLNMTGKLGINGEESFVNLQNISAELGSNTFNGNCLITNLKDPYLNLTANVSTKLEELNAFWPMDTLQYISGSIEMQAFIKGALSEMKQSAFSPNIQAEGSASLKDIKTKFKGKENEINISQGNFVLKQRNVSVTDFNILIGKSDLQLTGELPEFLNYLFDSKKALLINANLKSNYLALEDVLYSGTETGGDITIPENLNFNLKSEIGKLTFAKFEADSLRGSIAIKDQKVLLKELELNAMDGKGKIDAIADASGKNILIQADASLDGINISKLLYQFNNFGQNTLNDQHLKGFATAEIEFSGTWSKALVADLKTIAATGSVTIERGQLVNFKPLESLSKYVDVSELRDIKFSTLQGTFEIKNEVTSIPKTTIKNSAMNLDIWGKHSFNNEIEYHFRLLLSEMLANKKRANKKLNEELELVENDPENKRSVFVLMRGTVDNPIIKYDRKGMKQKIGEDIKSEKQNLKQLLKEEFGWFKKDSINSTKSAKADQKFQVDFGDKKKDQPKTLQPKKKEEDDDDF